MAVAVAFAGASPLGDGFARAEVAIVPLVGGDTDVGVGVGQLSTVAAVPPPASRLPFRWAVESSAFISFKREDGKLISPYQDFYVQWTAPALLGGRLRLEARPSFTRESTQRYYGLGNASVAPANDVASRDFYGRTHPMLWARARYRFWDQLQVGFGSYYLQNWLKVPAGGTLAQQIATGDATVRRLLGDTANHGVLILEGLLLYDSRDSELVTDSGQFHQIKLRVSPRLGPAVPYSYQQINVTSRFFLTVIRDRLVLAARYLADVQLGNPPFYELARYDDTYALGGGNGVRGVPGQRYYGKVKVFASAEARVRVGAFELRHKHMTVGVAGFFDAGRAWAELASHPELDGTGIGLKYGVGAGLRVQEGKTFVVRGDIAWSPDARPIGGYVTAGQAF
jgi:outer membrane protein assembly factor BamA